MEAAHASCGSSLHNLFIFDVIAFRLYQRKIASMVNCRLGIHSLYECRATQAKTHNAIARLPGLEVFCDVL